jgi:Ribbon-helix-helix protein, copG family
MKRLWITLDDDLDEALERQASEGGTSKDALIRRYLRERVQAVPPFEQDPIWDFAVKSEGRSGDSNSVDHVAYPR